MSLRWMVSDLHWGHKQVLKYDNRPFKTIEEMNETIITNWNKVVKNNHIVYLLGDVSFLNKRLTFEYLNRLKGQIILIRGNHDDIFNIATIKKYSNGNIIDMTDLSSVYIGGEKHILYHYPRMCMNQIQLASPHWLIHGHNHLGETINHEKKEINVSINKHRYFPVSENEIIRLKDKRNI